MNIVPFLFNHRTHFVPLVFPFTHKKYIKQTCKLWIKMWNLLKLILQLQLWSIYYSSSVIGYYLHQVPTCTVVQLRIMAVGVMSKNLATFFLNIMRYWCLSKITFFSLVMLRCQVGTISDIRTHVPRRICFTMYLFKEIKMHWNLTLPLATFLGVSCHIYLTASTSLCGIFSWV